jgi:hypothetical protein
MSKAKKPKKPASAKPAPKKSLTKKSTQTSTSLTAVSLIKPSPVLSTAYNCLNTPGDLTFYLLEIGAKDAKPFVFDLPPRSVTWKKSFLTQEVKTQGNTSQPLYFSMAENKKLSLSGIIFDHNKNSLPHEKLELLQSLQVPVKTKLRVYQLLVGNLVSNQFAARSYGKFIISSIDVAEQMRDVNSGKTVRAVVNIELTEVSSQQLDFGRDLSVPRSLVPTLPEELTASSSSGSGSDSVNPGSESTPTSGNIITAGTTIATVGYRGVFAGINSSHLHMSYIAPGKTKDQTMAPLYKTGQLPLFVRNAVSLGPWQGIEKKKLSQLNTYSGVLASRTVNGKTRPHKGADYQLTPLAQKAMFNCPINIEVDMYFKQFFTVAEGAPTSLSVLELECFVKGYEGVYQFIHVEKLAPGIDTSKKRITSKQPNNPGGNTPAANTVKNATT